MNVQPFLQSYKINPLNLFKGKVGSALRVDLERFPITDILQTPGKSLNRPYILFKRIANNFGINDRETLNKIRESIDTPLKDRFAYEFMKTYGNKKEIIDNFHLKNMLNMLPMVKYQEHVDLLKGLGVLRRKDKSRMYPSYVLKELFSFLETPKELQIAKILGKMTDNKGNNVFFDDVELVAAIDTISEGKEESIIATKLKAVQELTGLLEKIKYPNFKLSALDVIPIVNGIKIEPQIDFAKYLLKEEKFGLKEIENTVSFVDTPDKIEFERKYIEQNSSLRLVTSTSLIEQKAMKKDLVDSIFENSNLSVMPAGIKDQTLGDYVLNQELDLDKYNLNPVFIINKNTPEFTRNVLKFVNDNISDKLLLLPLERDLKSINVNFKSNTLNSVRRSLKKCKNMDLSDYNKLTESEKDILRLESNKINHEIYGISPKQVINISRAIKHSLDAKYGTNNYVFCSIGRSPAIFANVLNELNVETKILKYSKNIEGSNIFNRHLHTVEPKALDEYLQYLYSKGINSQNIQKSRKKYIFVDYADKGITLKEYKNVLSSAGLYPNNSDVIVEDLKKLLNSGNEAGLMNFDYDESLYDRYMKTSVTKPFAKLPHEYNSNHNDISDYNMKLFRFAILDSLYR